MIKSGESRIESMYLFQRIEEEIFQNSETKRAIGEFLLANKEHVGNYSMEEIAKLTFTSKPTLVRFAKTLGFSGWRDFMYAFSHEVVSLRDTSLIEVDPNYPFKKADDVYQIIENVATLQMQTIKDTLSFINPEEILSSAKLIEKSETIVIYGTSPNSYYGELFKRKLVGIGKRALFADLGEAGITSQSLSSKDCAVIISYSGNNPDREPTVNVKYLLKNHVPIIGITSAGENYLRKYSSFVLSISSKERLYSKISNYSTEESIMLVLNLLYSTVFSLNYEKNMERKINYSRTLEPQRETNSIFLAE